MVYVDEKGNVPFREWLESRAVTTKDAGKIDQKVLAIESISDELPPEWFPQYLSSDGLRELRVTGPGRKMLRPLGVRSGERTIILFYGSVEKGNKLDSKNLAKAEALKREWENGKGSLKAYFED